MSGGVDLLLFVQANKTRHVDGEQAIARDKQEENVAQNAQARLYARTVEAL